MTAPTTNNIQIHGVDIDVRMENPPGINTCNQVDSQLRLTGTLSGAIFTPGAAGSTRRFDFAGATGLSAHIPILGVPVTAVPRGSSAATGLLNVFD
jgi:hypothetical protein